MTVSSAQKVKSIDHTFNNNFMENKFYVAERLFGENNPYFNSFFLKFDHEELRIFMDSHEEESKYLTHFLFYIESLVCVKDIKDDPIFDFNKAGSLAHLHSGKLWYALLLTILIGLIDKSVSIKTDGSLCEFCGKTKNKARESFKSIMLQMEESEKRHFVNHYKGGVFHKKVLKK